MTKTLRIFGKSSHFVWGFSSFRVTEGQGGRSCTKAQRAFDESSDADNFLSPDANLSRYQDLSRLTCLIKLLLSWKCKTVFFWPDSDERVQSLVVRTKTTPFFCVRRKPANLCHPAEGEYDNPLPVGVSLSSQPLLILQFGWPVLGGSKGCNNLDNRNCYNNYCYNV